MEHEELISPQFGKTQGAASFVTKLHLENVGSENFNDRSHLSTHQPKRQLVFKQRYDIEELGGRRLHESLHTT